MMNDPLANVMSAILNAEITGKQSIDITPVSKVMMNVVEIMNIHGYLGKTEKIIDGKGGVVKVHLLGNINKCGVIKPRFNLKTVDFEKFEKRFLPAKNMGIMIVTTSKGMMTHEEAKKHKIGGKLIAYCY